MDVQGKGDLKKMSWEVEVEYLWDVWKGGMWEVFSVSSVL